MLRAAYTQKIGIMVIIIIILLLFLICRFWFVQHSGRYACSVVYMRSAVCFMIRWLLLTLRRVMFHDPLVAFDTTQGYVS